MHRYLFFSHSGKRSIPSFQISGVGVPWILCFLNVIRAGDTDDDRPRLLLLVFTRLSAKIPWNARNDIIFCVGSSVDIVQPKGSATKCRHTIFENEWFVCFVSKPYLFCIHHPWMYYRLSRCLTDWQQLSHEHYGHTWMSLQWDLFQQMGKWVWQLDWHTI